MEIDEDQDKTHNPLTRTRFTWTETAWCPVMACHTSAYDYKLAKFERHNRGRYEREKYFACGILAGVCYYYSAV